MKPNPILFDGYCPESFLKGKRIEMRLNEDDFWESEATGLQMTIFPPFATILRWRGRGKFRASSDFASNIYSGLMLAEAGSEDGQEILPDESKVIDNDFDLEWYLDDVYDSKEQYDAGKFNSADPALFKQEIYLNTIVGESLNKLLLLYNSVRTDADASQPFRSNSFTEFHKNLYELKMIFDYPWMKWRKGWKNIQNKDYDYSGCSLLELSMYLTAIFRSDRFNEGEIELNLENGTIDKIMQSIKQHNQEKL